MPKRRTADEFIKARRQRLDHVRRRGYVDPQSARGVAGSGKNSAGSRGRRWADRLLLLVEIAVVTGLIAIIVGLERTSQELNSEVDRLQRQESQRLARPLATPTAEATATRAAGEAIILPSGHKPPQEGQPPQPGEAGDIPLHLLAAIAAYVPPLVPTPGPEQAQRLQIPAIGVNHPIVQGDDWEQLKNGIGQHIGSGQAGWPGNVVLSAHNDIYGEPFRYLDQLSPGDEIIVHTESQSYTYIVRETQIVAPTDVWVMEATENASVTLISCYPFRINTWRIVVFADLNTGNGSS